MDLLRKGDTILSGRNMKGILKTWWLILGKDIKVGDEEITTKESKILFRI